MEIFRIVLTSLGSIIAMFFLTKLMGYRQLSQLSMFDYINGITIGSIAAEMATALENDFTKPLTAMIVYALAELLISFATDKSIVLDRFITGKPLVLMQNGELFYKNLKKAKIDLSEFMIQCRNSGYFDLANLHTAILEPNGKISFLPMSDQRPVTPKDMNLSPQQEMIVANVIIDGKIMHKNLQHTGNDEKWLLKQLHTQGINDPKDVFLATCDNTNALNVYVRIKNKCDIDLLD